MKQTIRLTESKLRSIIRESVKKCLYESYKVGSSWIELLDTSDLRVDIIPFTEEDGYPYDTIYDEDGNIEWEAKCEDGWYTLRGTYNRGEVYLDEIIEGHSGYGRSRGVGEKERDWFDENLSNSIKAKINKEEEYYNRQSRFAKH